MLAAAENLEFEEAARYRDEVKRLENLDLAIAKDPLARQYDIDSTKDADKIEIGRSKAGIGGTRHYRAKSIKKF